MKKRLTTIILFLILLCVCIFFAFNLYQTYRQIKSAHILTKNKKRAWLALTKNIENKVSHFNGKACIIIKDFDTGWEISLNENTPIPSASLVKVPIMISCFYAAQDGKINLSDSIIIKRSDKVGGSKIIGNAPAGSSFTVEELLRPMITQSDNAAANALIDFLGFETLKTYFKKLGLKNTNISRRMMDFEERKEGVENYTTAEDMAYLLEGLYKNKILNKDYSLKCLELLKDQKINDRIPRKLPKGGAFVAHKTGLERHICHDVGIVYTSRGDFIICVLVKHEDRYAKSAKKLIAEIALLTYNYYGDF